MSRMSQLHSSRGVHIYLSTYLSINKKDLSEIYVMTQDYLSSWCYDNVVSSHLLFVPSCPSGHNTGIPLILFLALKSLCLCIRLPVLTLKIQGPRAAVAW